VRDRLVAGGLQLSLEPACRREYLSTHRYTHEAMCRGVAAAGPGRGERPLISESMCSQIASSRQRQEHKERKALRYGATARSNASSLKK
jgi:hypothetical protein